MKRAILALGVGLALLATSATASADPGNRGNHNRGQQRGFDGHNHGRGYNSGYGYRNNYRPAYQHAAPYRGYGNSGYGYRAPFGYGYQPGLSFRSARPGFSFGFNLFR